VSASRQRGRVNMTLGRGLIVPISSAELRQKFRPELLFSFALSSPEIELKTTRSSHQNWLWEEVCRAEVMGTIRVQ
jgi:hypothetical protein